MGTTLTGKIVAETYDSLLKVTDNNTITGTKKRITDGFGNDTPLLLSSTDVQIDGNFLLPGTISQYVRGDGSLATLPTIISTLTTTGSSGASTLVGSTLNIPNYTLAGLGGVPTSRTLTINGTTFDLSANRSWTIADTGLTSVGVSMPSAFSVSGSPLTANGTIAITGAGTASQYIDGTGALQTFPTFLSADKLITEVYNSSGATLTKGTIVYINGTQGNLPTIAKALATGDATSAQTFGFVQTDITNMNNGYVIVAGKLTDLDTSAYTGGTQLYLSPTTAGTYTSTKQYAPNHLVYVGIVVRAHPTQGSIEVKIQNGYELDELHDVIAQTPSNNDGIFYNSTSTKWENKSIATALGFTPVPTTRTISTTAPLSGGGDLSANRTLSISQANTSTNGFLSSTDWNTFNSKVPSTRTLTINGTAYDLSADRSWTIAGGLSGSGTTNYVAKFTGTSAIGNSQIFDNGTNVGIGTASPSQKFEIFQANNSTSFLLRNGTTSSHNVLYAGNDSSTNSSFIGSYKGDDSFYSNLVLQKFGGNVGIGTTSPSRLLSVNGQGYIAADIFQGSNSGIFFSGDGSYASGIYGRNSGLELALQTNSNERMRITSTGNVGIGTTIPRTKLEVESYTTFLSVTSNINSEATTDNQQIGGIDFRKHYGLAIGASIRLLQSGGTSNYSQSHLAFYTNEGVAMGTLPSEKMRITSGGNVGIGIASPNAKLNVAGTTLIQNSGADTWFGYGGSYDNYFSTPNGGKQVFRNASSDIMTLTSAGNVLINTTSDNNSGAKLQVTGGISYQNIFNAQGGTTYTLALTDQSKIIEMQNGGANNVTIPLDSSVNFPIGTEIQVLQFGAGQTTIVATSGVTTRSKSNQIKIANQNTGVTLVKRAANDWYIIGNLTA